VSLAAGGHVGPKGRLRAAKTMGTKGLSRAQASMLVSQASDRETGAALTPGTDQAARPSEDLRLRETAPAPSNNRPHYRSCIDS